MRSTVGPPAGAAPPVGLRLNATPSMPEDGPVLPPYLHFLTTWQTVARNVRTRIWLLHAR